MGVAAGTYPGQTLVHDRRRPPANVVFRPLTGAAVSVTGRLNVCGSYLTIRLMGIVDLTVRPEDLPRNPPAVTNVTPESITAATSTSSRPRT